jgi:hypothetical protein
MQLRPPVVAPAAAMPVKAPLPAGVPAAATLGQWVAKL